MDYLRSLSVDGLAEYLASQGVDQSIIEILKSNQIDGRSFCLLDHIHCSRMGIVYGPWMTLFEIIQKASAPLPSDQSPPSSSSSTIQYPDPTSTPSSSSSPSTFLPSSPLSFLSSPQGGVTPASVPNKLSEEFILFAWSTILFLIFIILTLLLLMDAACRQKKVEGSPKTGFFAQGKEIKSRRRTDSRALLP